MIPLIMTYTKKHVDPTNLKPEDIDILDIAHALANCNRFAGHTRVPINVAQHSVYVSRVAEELNDDQRLARQALLHDASEAYIGDITKWLKGTEAFALYCEIEDRIQTQIYQHFNCNTKMYEQVAKADKIMLRFEGEKGFGLRQWEKWTINLPNYPLINEREREMIGAWAPWSWKSSRQGFLDRARSVGISV